MGGGFVSTNLGQISIHLFSIYVKVEPTLSLSLEDSILKYTPLEVKIDSNSSKSLLSNFAFSNIYFPYEFFERIQSKNPKFSTYAKIDVFNSLVTEFEFENLKIEEKEEERA